MLATLVAFPTVSSRSNLDLIGFVEGYLGDLGVKSVRVPDETGEKASLFAQIGPDVPGGVVLSGHSDVVPVKGQDWSSDPFTLTERHGRLHGRGSWSALVRSALARLAPSRTAPCMVAVTNLA
jgi:acetylornithine deacetylase